MHNANTIILQRRHDHGTIRVRAKHNHDMSTSQRRHDWGPIVTRARVGYTTAAADSA